MSLLNTLIDSFTDNSTNTNLWSSFSSSATVSEVGGQLVITLANATVGSNYAGYTSVSTYDLTGNYGLIKVIQVGSVSTNAQTYMKFYPSGNSSTNNYQIIQQNGTISFQKTISSSITTLFSEAYNATVHVWWRIRESGGTIFWDTSVDRVNWTNKASDPISTAITALVVEIGAGTFQSETSPGSAFFQNFNLLPGVQLNNARIRPRPFSPGLAR